MVVMKSVVVVASKLVAPILSLDCKCEKRVHTMKP